MPPSAACSQRVSSQGTAAAASLACAWPFRAAAVRQSRARRRRARPRRRTTAPHAPATRRATRLSTRSSSGSGRSSRRTRSRSPDGRAQSRASARDRSTRRSGCATARRSSRRRATSTLRPFSRAGSRSTCRTSWPTARSGTGSRPAIPRSSRPTRPRAAQVYASGERRALRRQEHDGRGPGVERRRRGLAGVPAHRRSRLAHEADRWPRARRPARRRSRLRGAAAHRPGLRARGERLHGRLGRREPRPTPDQRAIYLDEATPVVVGLYANAFFARAAEELAELLDAAANPARAEHWRQLAASVRAAIDRAPLERGRGLLPAAPGGRGAWQQRRRVRRLGRLRSRRQCARRPLRARGRRARGGGSSRSPTRGAAPSASPRSRPC